VGARPPGSKGLPNALAGVLLFFSALLVSQNAHASPPSPGWTSVLAQLTLPACVLLFTFLGGGYTIMEAKGNRASWIRGLLAVLVVLILGTGWSFVIVSIGLLTIFAITRAVEMLLWTGELAFRKSGALKGLEMHPLRPFGGAVSLALAAIFFAGVALYTASPNRDRDALQQCRAFVAAQLAHTADTSDGKPRYETIEVVSPIPDLLLEVTYAEDRTEFVAQSVWIRDFPIPWNFVLRGSAYRGDSSGLIRKRVTTQPSQRCGTEEPVVDRASAQQARQLREPGVFRYP